MRNAGPERRLKYLRTLVLAEDQSSVLHNHTIIPVPGVGGGEGITSTLTSTGTRPPCRQKTLGSQGACCWGSLGGVALPEEVHP